MGLPVGSDKKSDPRLLTALASENSISPLHPLPFTQGSVIHLKSGIILVQQISVLGKHLTAMSELTRSKTFDSPEFFLGRSSIARTRPISTGDAHGQNLDYRV